MIKYCDIFWSFFKVGAFTIGGGYAMIPMMQRELVDRHRWLSEEEFMDQVALSQALPGVFAVNMASVTGNRLRGTRGAAVAVVGNIMMPIIFILLLAVFFRSFRDNPYVTKAFLGLRPAVVALVAAPVFRMFKTEFSKWKSSGSRHWALCLIFIPVVSAMLIWLLGVNPIVVVLAAALLGYVYSLFAVK